MLEKDGDLESGARDADSGGRLRVASRETPFPAEITTPHGLLIRSIALLLTLYPMRADGLMS